MPATQNTISIRNMVCQRCVLSVENILTGLNIPFSKVALGSVQLTRPLTGTESTQLEKALNKVGFEMIETRVNKIIEDIKQAIFEYLALGMDSQQLKLSSFITNKIPYE